MVLGNEPCDEALPALAKGVNDTDAMVRAASAWALGRYADRAARNALEGRLAIESDGEVREEIVASLDERHRREFRQH